ncbi:hypothetical protein ElyMa_001863800 [Elysia marginata]|uniref:Transmembrane protein n=1 Tax=Elysia marginata TaxID=1093978 RepID=A0AAV4EMZ6_9GAST|nr:hypothetical protein ElyMa_001863800 [Elysia marginata]
MWMGVVIKVKMFGHGCASVVVDVEFVASNSGPERVFRFPDVLFVAFGACDQELSICFHFDYLVVVAVVVVVVVVVVAVVVLLVVVVVVV